MSPSDSVLTGDRHAVLLVGGLDTSAGAGLLVDAMAVRDLGLHPVVTATAIAVQNTSHVARTYPLPASLVREQLNVMAEEFPIGAVKSGMLPSAEIVDVFADWLSTRPRLPLVVDPVLRATSGSVLVDDASMEAMRRVLFPRSRIITPNLDEAAALTGYVIQTKDDLPRVAERLLEWGPEWVLVKGGHLNRDDAVDYLASKQEGTWLTETRREHGNTRGTGCALASAIAAHLARGDAMVDAVRSAKAWLIRAMDNGYTAGRGRFLYPQS